MTTLQEPADKGVPPQKLQRERVNETRYTRTFTISEISKILRDEVLVEANRSSYEFGHATIEIVSPTLAESVTVKVTMTESKGY